MKSRGVALAAAALVVAGCKADPTPSGEPKPARDAGAERPRETAILTAVAIERIEPAKPLPIRDEDLTRRLGALLTSSPAFLEEGEKPPAGRVAVPAVVAVTLRYDVVTPPAGARRVAVVGVEAEVDWKTSGERMAPRENVLIERPLEKADEARLGPLMLELAAQAVEQAGRGLVAKESLRQGDDGAVLAALGQQDPDLVLWALDLCAARRLAGAFDRAIALLDASDPGVQAAALRVLVALRDPRAVEPLARRADFADPDTMRALVEAVSAIGGPEAIEFLEMVAGGHAEADMRQRAREGLERLGRRQRKDP
ncbi:MAG TPA: HEAT repeat domain-containing protein [Kofleriaceae bacterium]|nr:HEAT repeat domain-containing protein [Kofleriaceae bacterium]